MLLGLLRIRAMAVEELYAAGFWHDTLDRAVAELNELGHVVTADEWRVRLDKDAEATAD